MNGNNRNRCQWWPNVARMIRGMRCEDDGTLVIGHMRFSSLRKPGNWDDPFYDDDPRIEALQSHLYATLYAGIETVKTGEPLWRPDWQTVLHSSPWQVVEQLSGGALVAQSGIHTRRLEPGEYLFDGVPARAKRGSIVMRHRPQWSDRLDSAFHYVFGASETDGFSEDTLVRYYFAATSQGLRDVVEALVKMLHEAELPFFLKYPSSTAAMVRRDALVLYVGARYAHATHWLLAQKAACWRQIGLRTYTPMWTLPLMPGLGFAQDPADGDSFGLNRCRVLARGLLAAAQTPETRPLVPVRQAFFEAGIDWERPHLELDEQDRFGLRDLLFAPAV
jgi:hypothetical protein